MKASVFGHNEIYDEEKYEEKVKEQLLNFINNYTVHEFKIGGIGRFDYICAKVLWELKREYPKLKTYLVLAYINNNLDVDEKKYITEFYDEVVYPPIEHVPYKSKISARNRWMIDESDYILFCVNHTWGGANSVREYAIKKGKKYVNIGNIGDCNLNWQTFIVDNLLLIYRMINVNWLITRSRE